MHTRVYWQKLSFEFSVREKRVFWCSSNAALVTGRLPVSSASRHTSTPKQNTKTCSEWAACLCSTSHSYSESHCFHKWDILSLWSLLQHRFIPPTCRQRVCLNALQRANDKTVTVLFEFVEQPAVTLIDNLLPHPLTSLFIHLILP